jgi:MFS family permease
MTGMPEHARPRRILPAIVVSQFAGTSLWFATNAIIPDLRETWQLGEGAIGSVTSAVQFGFIAGTLLVAFFTLADRFSPRRIFLFSSLFGAACNLLLLVAPRTSASLLALRFLAGLALAGIYPVGMKIASGWYRHGLGSALGFLVGALVLGTSFPHLLRGFGFALGWQEVIVAVSLLAASGGILMAAAVPDGPYLTATASFSLASLPAIFAGKDLRAAAIGYFGHMWELYTFYAYVPVMLAIYAGRHTSAAIDV